MISKLEIRPQPGFQEKVWACSADIAFIGGQAGGGKTCSLVMEPLKWVHIPSFNATFIRKDKERIRNTGGLWHESRNWYVEGTAVETILKWRFPSGAEIDMEGIEHMSDLEKWRGSQIPLLLGDEVTELEEEKFWFMISRNRGIVNFIQEGRKKIFRPYSRWSCNPKPNSWVSRLLEWWIDQDTGFPIDERDGVLRYFVRHADRMYWGDSKDEVINSCPQVIEKMKLINPDIKPHDLIKSFTFIRGKLSDNRILTSNSPEYYGNLLALDDANQKIFLEGNWKIATDGLDLFNPNALNSLFKVTLSDVKENEKKYIVVDAAKFGQDLCTIYLFEGWIVTFMIIMHISDAKDIYNEIEWLRKPRKIPKENVLVDQDGIGGDTVKLGGYNGFRARMAVTKDRTTKQKENFKSFKDQCFFHSAEMVNSGECRMLLMSSNVKIYDRGATHPRYSLKIKWKGSLKDIKELIIQQLNSIRKGESFFEGGEVTYEINSKNEQKEILGGVSPDFADPIGMRSYFNLIQLRKGKSKLH